jgi:hypothetical protein
MVGCVRITYSFSIELVHSKVNAMREMCAAVRDDEVTTLKALCGKVVSRSCHFDFRVTGSYIRLRQ